MESHAAEIKFYLSVDPVVYIFVALLMTFSREGPEPALLIIEILLFQSFFSPHLCNFTLLPAFCTHQVSSAPLIADYLYF